MEHAAIRLEAGGKTPFYEQLYAYFAAAIRSGALAPGERLPSKRRLAQDVGVSVSTVETAYAMLVAEGYLEAKPRSGFRVCRLSALSRPAAPAPAAPAPVQAPLRFDFSTGSVDTALFPFAAWRRLQRQVLAGDEAVLRAGCAQGDEALRRAIATHLAEFRGVHADPRQVVVGAGSVVTKDIPSGYLAYGNPCKPVRPITAADSKRHLILEEDLEHVRYNV